MEETIQVLLRTEINSPAWDACVAASSQRILYGYSWYLDAVLPAPFWKWAGIVLTDKTGQYQAVMPIPLRQKRIAGVACGWVVHQPFFCQILGVFSRKKLPDSTSDFWRIAQKNFRYGSTISVRQQPENPFLFDTSRAASTQILDLSVNYPALYRHYTPDRRQNLRRAQAAGWTVIESADIEPLLTLFRENHAAEIEGGVADWAYIIFKNLLAELGKRDLATVRYAVLADRIEAGALFVQEGNRIVYLFNAASEMGRRGNARTLLIDQIVQENAGRRCAGEAIIFDFESPEKPTIRAFYKSFGASEEPFWEMRWNQLGSVENAVRKAIRVLKQMKSGLRT